MEVNSSTEFIKWMHYLEEADWHQTTKADHYMAQLAFLVGQFMEGMGGVSSARRRRYDDYVIKFKRSGETPAAPAEKMTPGQRADYAKQVWAARLGMKSLPA